MRSIKIEIKTTKTEPIMDSKLEKRRQDNYIQWLTERSIDLALRSDDDDGFEFSPVELQTSGSAKSGDVAIVSLSMLRHDLNNPKAIRCVLVLGTDTDYLTIMPFSPYTVPCVAMEFKLDIEGDAPVLQAWNTRPMLRSDFSKLFVVANIGRNNLNLARRMYSNILQGTDYLDDAKYNTGPVNDGNSNIRKYLNEELNLFAKLSEPALEHYFKED